MRQLEATFWGSECSAIASIPGVPLLPIPVIVTRRRVGATSCRLSVQGQGPVFTEPTLEPSMAQTERDGPLDPNVREIVNLRTNHTCTILTHEPVRTIVVRVAAERLGAELAETSHDIAHVRGTGVVVLAHLGGVKALPVHARVHCTSVGIIAVHQITRIVRNALTRSRITGVTSTANLGRLIASTICRARTDRARISIVAMRGIVALAAKPFHAVRCITTTQPARTTTTISTTLFSRTVRDARQRRRNNTLVVHAHQPSVAIVIVQATP